MREHCILSIETSGELCSVAVGVNGVIIDTITAKEIRNHAAQITQLIYNLMQKVNLPFSRLNAIATNKGPGSYTGLRIGAAVAKGLCYALNKPLIAVDSLFAMAKAAIDEFGHSSKENGQNNNSVAYIAVLDARRNDVYLTMLDDVGNEILPSKKITVTTAADINFASSYKNINLVGNGAGKVQPFLPLTAAIQSAPDFQCSANHLYQIAATHYNEHKFVDMAYFEPAYL